LVLLAVWFRRMGVVAAARSCQDAVIYVLMHVGMDPAVR
jgi:hypothetical protein